MVNGNENNNKTALLKASTGQFVKVCKKFIWLI